MSIPAGPGPAGTAPEDRPLTGRNVIGGSVAGNAVQASAIHGGVHLHTAAPPGAAGRVPRQLPAQPSHFTGRRDVLAAIAGALAAAETGAPALVIISGGGGTGKTAVAVRALHQAAGQCPGGQLYAALGGFTPAARTAPAAVLARWLRALGVHPAAVPAGPDEAAALWRTLTAQAPVAVLADDAAGPAQVRALLPGAGLLIATSRHQLASLVTTDGARFLQLGPLPASAAAELAASLSGRGDPAASFTALTARCGHLPLAIRAAAARLAVRPRLHIQQLAAELAAAGPLTALDTPGMEGIITMTLQSSYDTLTSEAARGCRLLSLHPGPAFTAQAAAALLDTGTPQAAELTATLTAASLLEETGPGRWRFHDLTRDFAAQPAACDTPQDRDAATGRVIDYYLRASAAADLLLLPGRVRTAAAFGLPSRCPPAHPSPADALAWLDTELDNVLAAQEAAAAGGMHQAAWQYCDTMWAWCTSRHDYLLRTNGPEGCAAPARLFVPGSAARVPGCGSVAGEYVSDLAGSVVDEDVSSGGVSPPPSGGGVEDQRDRPGGHSGGDRHGGLGGHPRHARVFQPEPAADKASGLPAGLTGSHCHGAFLPWQAARRRPAGQRSALACAGGGPVDPHGRAR